MKKLIPVIAVIAAMAAGTLGLFVFLEVAVRVKNRMGAAAAGPAGPGGAQMTDERAFDPHPYLVVYSRPNARRPTLSTNSEGFRGTKEYSFHKKTGMKRVFVIGGSAAFGMNATKDEATIAGELEKRLNAGETEPKYEVINAACLGFNSHQDMILMGLEIMHRDPDLIISFAGGTDLNTSMNPKWTRNYHELVEEAAAEQNHPWHRHSQAVQFLKGLIPLPVKSAGVGVFHEEAPQNLVENIRSMAGMASAGGVKFLSVLQPSLAVSTKQVTPKEQERYQKAKGRGQLPTNYEALIRRLYSSTQTAAKGLSLPKGTAFLDGTDLFAGSDIDAFSDAFHLTDEGYRVAAQNILTELSRLHYIEPVVRSVSSK